MRRLLPFLLAPLLVAALLGAKQKQNPLERAKQLLEMKQYSLAIETLNGLIEKDPKNTAALSMREEAEKLNAAAENEAQVQQLLVEAHAYLDATQTKKARTKLEKLLELDPNQAEAKQMLAKIELDSDMDLLASEEGTDESHEGDFVDLGNVDEPPHIVRKYAATYPRIARQMGIEGKARLLATIGSNGKVEKVQFLKRIEGWDALNRNAAKAVRRFEFTPATKDGVKVKTIVTLSVDFRL